VKSFAREGITPTLPGIFATTTSSATKLHFATFHISYTGSLCFCLTLQVLLLLFLEKAQTEFLPSLCRAVCNQLSGYPLHFVSQGRPPFDFTTVNVIFDISITDHFRSTPLQIPYYYSSYN